MIDLPSDYRDDLWEHGRDGLHIVDAEGIIRDANPADYEPLGYTRDEYVGRHIARFHADRDVVEDILRRLAAGEVVHNCRARMLCKDGSTRTVSITSEMRFDVEGKPVHTRCFIRDITELACLQDQIARQAAILAEMEVPIAEVWERVVLATVVGVLDSVRAGRLTAALLPAISVHSARFTIVDLTAIGGVDTATADHLIRLCKAVRLLGASVVLTGIAPAVAQTMVTLGIDMREAKPFGRLRDGLRWCIGQLTADSHK